MSFFVGFFVGGTFLRLGGRRLVCACYYNHKLASWLVGEEVLQHLTEGASDALFVYLAYLAAYATFTLLTKHFDELFEGFLYAMGAFVEYHGACLGFQCFDAAHAPFFLGKEAFEAESVAGQSAADYGWDEGCRAWQGDNFDALGYGLACYEKTWIADAGGSCIAY